MSAAVSRSKNLEATSSASKPNASAARVAIHLCRGVTMMLQAPNLNNTMRRWRTETAQRKVLKTAIAKVTQKSLETELSVRWVIDPLQNHSCQVVA
jgi:hypothetical protein